MFEVGKIFKEKVLRRGNLRSITLWLIVLGILLNPIPLFNQNESLEGLVYCPLQKTWVKQNIPQPKIEDDLDDICASDKLKVRFSLQLIQKTIGFQPKTETLFFNYLQKGDLVFVEINHHSNLPDSNLAQNHRIETIVNNFRQEVGRQELIKFTLQEAPRPPTLTEKKCEFESQSVQTLEQISRNINPRSPPFFI